MKTKIWRDLARIGVITDRFGDDTTGRYSAKTKNDSLRTDGVEDQKPRPERCEGRIRVAEGHSQTKVVERWNDHHGDNALLARDGDVLVSISQ
jgi:hypothetical protein